MDPFINSNDFYQTVFNNVSIGICLMDLRGRIISVNPHICNILGYSEEELQSRNWFELTHPDDQQSTRNKMNQLLEGEADSISFRKQLVRQNGDVFWSSVGVFLKRDGAGDPQFFIAHIKDISREKELETQLRHSQKTEAIATLAGGIAHDFNNILSSILGNAEFALRHELKNEDPGTYSIKQIIKAGKRASFLVKQILTFSRKRKSERSQISVNPIAKEITKLLKSTLPANIDVRLKLNNSFDTLLADPVNIHLMIMNLCTNAAEAMQGKGGQLEIALENTDKDGNSSPGTGASVEAGFLKISVSDSGTGMPPEILERVFDPYFTTKSPEKGTGLGLSVVHGIIEDLNGHISIESEPGQGSCFTILIPLYEKPQAEKIQPDTHQEQTKGARILFVDDDEQIVEFMERSLEAGGFQVTVKTDSIEALHEFSQSPDQFDIIISDMNMNGYSGDILAKKILEIRPDIPIIICTGYDELLDENVAKKIGIREVIMKPFMIDQLTETIQRLLAATDRY